MKKKQKRIYIYGKNVVREALMHAPHIVKAIYLSPQMSDSKLGSLVHKSNIPVEKIDPKRVSSQVEGNAPHQGIIAHVNLDELLVPFEQFIQTVSPDAEQMFVYLDGVQDPHNVGTIIRASAAFGATAVLLPEHGTSPITPGVVKASVGALFSAPVVRVINPQQALGELRRKKVTIYGMAGEGASSIVEEKFSHATLFVLGNEADGVSPATRAMCEKMLRIPIKASVESLNVASAATAALFAWSIKHPADTK
jgi:23S rRNA (guanosine2251-2'-O)-methyltransferase